MNKKYFKLGLIILLLLCLWLGYKAYSLNQENGLLKDDILTTTNVLKNLDDQRMEFNNMANLSTKIDACQKQKDSECVNRLTNQWMQSAQDRNTLEKQFPALWGEMQKSAQQLKTIFK
jgi:hypothetical protein